MSDNNCRQIYFVTVLILIITIFVLSNNIVEGFYNFNDMVEFTKLDDSLIRRYKIGSSYNLYDSDVLNLFRNDQVIRIKIPINYVAKIIYKYNDNNKGFAKTIELIEGNYDIKKSMGDKTIDQIIIKNINNSNLIYRDPIYPRYDYYYQRYDYPRYNYPRYDYPRYNYPIYRPFYNSYPRHQYKHYVRPQLF